MRNFWPKLASTTGKHEDDAPLRPVDQGALDRFAAEAFGEGDPGPVPTDPNAPVTLDGFLAQYVRAVREAFDGEQGRELHPAQWADRLAQRFGLVAPEPASDGAAVLTYDEFLDYIEACGLDFMDDELERRLATVLADKRQPLELWFSTLAHPDPAWLRKLGESSSAATDPSTTPATTPASSSSSVTPATTGDDKGGKGGKGGKGK
jgi:hypothetical protein